MSRARTTMIGATLGLVVVLGCLGSAALVQWYEEGREIALCDAAKDFWDANERAPASISELAPPSSSYTTTRDGQPYAWSCTDDSDVPACALSWPGPEDGQRLGRSCGRLDERSVVDWF
jgi:hypothetical protein